MKFARPCPPRVVKTMSAESSVNLLLGHHQPPANATPAPTHVSIQTGGHSLSISMQHLTAIKPRPAIMPAPGTAWWFAGIGQVNETATLIIDLAGLANAQMPNLEQRFVAIIEHKEQQIGLLADQIDGETESNATPAQALSPILSDDGVLDPERLFDQCLAASKDSSA